MNRVTFRGYEESDFPAVLALLRSAFPKLVFSEAWWTWFTSGPTRNYLAIFPGEAREVGGLFSLIEFPELRGSEGSTMRGVLAANLCLAPEYQRRVRGGDISYFEVLARHVCETERDLGVDALLVVPNVNSAGRLKQGGWERLAELRTWEDRSLAKESAAAPLGEFVAVDLRKSGAFSQAPQVTKTCGFLEWRLGRRPESAYLSRTSTSDQPGWIGKRFTDSASGETRFHLLDFGVTSAESFAATLRELQAAAAGAHVANFWLTAGHSLEKVAESNGFTVAASRPLLMRALSARASKLRAADLFFSFADCDVY